MKPVRKIRSLSIRKLAQAVLTALLLTGCGSGSAAPEPSAAPSARPSATPRTTPEPAQETKKNEDPLALSFRQSDWYEEAVLRNRLAGSRLGHCSHVQKTKHGYILTWNRKEDGREVYRCTYTYDSGSKSSDKSVCECESGEAFYDDYDGSGLIRYYVMPEPGDEIDMFVYPTGSGYYDKYFILGKYSDMSCYISGEDIYFEYSWYQNTENGPVLVYRSTATNYETTSGQRYNEELWASFEESAENIDIVPYEDYPRSRDYYDVYREWAGEEYTRREEADLKDKIEEYCACGDEEDLFDLYGDDFDSYDDAEAFWEKYCR